MNRGIHLTPFVPAPTVISCLLTIVQDGPVLSSQLPAFFEFGSAVNDHLGQLRKRVGRERFTGCQLSFGSSIVNEPNWSSFYRQAIREALEAGSFVELSLMELSHNAPPKRCRKSQTKSSPPRAP